MKPNFYVSLNAFSNRTRFEVIQLLSEHDGPLSFTKLLELLGYETKNSSNLANHLKKLVELNMVEKDSSSYRLTKLGKQLYNQMDEIEKIIDEHNKDIMVRTSDLCFEPFDESKIALNLIREANLSESEAFELARTAKHKIFNANITYLTAPLIREFTNFILLESGKEEARHKLTRLGLPPYDVKQLLMKGNFRNSTMLYNELGKNIMEQFLLLNLLPQRFADFYLSGKLFFLYPESWGLSPLEVVISGEKFAKILYEQAKGYESRPSDSGTSINQFLPLAITNLIEYFRNFFSGGVVITEFERVIHNLADIFAQPVPYILDLLLEMIPSAIIQLSHDERNLHNRTWEIWFEVDLKNIPQYIEEINLIVSKYHGDLSSTDGEEPQNTLITRPNLLINISSEAQSIYLDVKSYRELPLLYKKILKIALTHNVSLISPQSTRQGKTQKSILTPHLNPVILEQNQNSSLILDKIYVNLPKIIQIAENFPNSNNPTEECLSITSSQNQSSQKNKTTFAKDQRIFLDTLSEWVCYAINLFDEKMEILSKHIGKLTNWSHISNLLFDVDPFEKPTDLVDYTGAIPIVCSICLNGIREAVRYYTKFLPEQTRDSFQFLKEIISSVSNLLQSNTKQNKVSYALSQTHLDNYLQVRYHQDIPLLNYLEEINAKTPGNTNSSSSSSSTSSSYPVYHYSIFADHSIEGLKKLVHNFKTYQQELPLAFLSVQVPRKISKKQLLHTVKTLLKNQIHSFGFSQIYSSKENLYFRYAGAYKPLSYYDSFLQALIRENNSEHSL